MDDNNKPAEVPGLILKDHEDLRRFFNAHNRKALNKYYADEAKKMKSAFEIEKSIAIIKNERVKIALD